MEVATQKELGIVVTSALLSVITLFAAATFFSAGTIVTAAIIILLLLGLLWIATQALALAIVSSPWSAVVLIIVPALATVAASRISVGGVGGAIILLIALVMARRTLAHDIKDRVSYRTDKVFGHGTRTIIIGLILAVAGLALPTLEGFISREGIAISESQVELTLKSIEPIISGLAPGIGPAANLDDLIDARIEEEFGPGTTISPAQREQIRAELSQRLGTQVSGQESLAAIVSQRLNDSLKTITQANAFVVALLLLLLGFLSLRALIPVFDWIVIGELLALVWILQKTGLVKITEEQATIERLAL